MTPIEILGFTGAFAFVAFVVMCIHYTSKWGAETRKREEEFEKATSVEVVDERGDTLIVVRPVQSPTSISEYEAARAT